MHTQHCNFQCHAQTIAMIRNSRDTISLIASQVFKSKMDADEDKGDVNNSEVPSQVASTAKSFTTDVTGDEGYVNKSEVSNQVA